MANIINSIIANQPIPNREKQTSANPFDTAGKIKPLEAKGELLPSRIFGSPITYMQDLKDDFVNIKNAAKGKANDHQLGRINDVAMKAGSLALASYLFVKNPLKLNKAMEYAGFGTFFASMALWPKLAIQLPIKARTGVDIHQKYIDSQGRKKMLFQDPQYDLTDLYSREDLDKMGKGLNVSENLPDRDTFIKQRAKKTAVQGNTLWMMTAGIATPVMSALGCNTLEKPIANIMEKNSLAKTQRTVMTPDMFTTSDKIKGYMNEKLFAGFLKANKDKPFDDNMISMLTDKITAGMNSAEIKDGVRKELETLKSAPKLSSEKALKALEGKFDFSKLTEASKEAFDKAISENNFKNAANIIALADGKKGKAKQTFMQDITRTLNAAKDSLPVSQTLGETSERVALLHNIMAKFGKDKKVLDKYMDVRAGKKAGTYIANQMGRISNKVLNSLTGKTKSFINDKELKALAGCDYEMLSKKFDSLVQSKNYDKFVSDLVGMVNDFENTAGTSSYVKTVADRVSGPRYGIFTKASENLYRDNFADIAGVLSNGKDSVANAVKTEAKESVTGAQSTFYRLLQAVDLHKKIQDGVFKNELKTAIEKQGGVADEKTIEKLTSACKKFILSATTTDNTEKLMSAGYKLSESEYKAVMDVLYSPDAKSSLAESLAKRTSPKEADKLLKGFNAYLQEFRNKVVNWENGMTPELKRRTINEVDRSANAVARNDLVGRPLTELVQDAAKNKLNSNKWLKIFGGIMLALTVVTVGATFAFGRKDETEKQKEAENQGNV